MELTKSLLISTFLVGIVIHGALLEAAERGVAIYSAALNTTGATQEVKLRWQTDPTKHYQLFTSMSLTNEVWDAAGGDIPAPALTYETVVPVTNQTSFFRVEQLDREPPVFKFIDPLKDAVAVPTNSAVSILLTDASEIDTNTVVFTINSTDYSLSAPELSFYAGMLIYSNAAGLGAEGATVSLQVAAVDIESNSSTSSMSELSLEVELVQAGRIMTIGGGSQPAPAEGISLASSTNLLLVETLSDRLVFDYTDTHGIYTNLLLASTDPNNIFYRCVTSIVDNVSNTIVTAYTRDARLEEFFTQGSFNSEGVSWTEYIEDTNGVMTAAIKPAWEAPFELGIQENGEIFPLSFGDENMSFEGNLGTWSLGASTEVTANFEPTGNLVWIAVPPHLVPEIEMDRCDVVMDGELNVTIGPSLMVAAAASESASTGLITPIRKFKGAMAGPVPVWVEMTFEIDLCADISAEAAASFETSVSIERAINYHLQLRDAEWKEIADGDTGWQYTFIAPQISLDGSLNARVYLQPKITVYVYSLVGAHAALEPYVEYNGQYTLLPEYHYRNIITAGLDFTLGMDVRFWPEDQWGPLPSWNFPLLSKQLYFNEGPNSVSPVIVSAPQDVTIIKETPVSFSVLANSTSPLTYRWYHNGVDTRRTSSTISFTGTEETAGTYRVVVTNQLGTAEASATLTVQQSPMIVQTGLVAYYPFDGNALDQSGNDYHGNNDGATSTINRFGQSDKAMYFDGSSSITVPYDLPFRLNQTFSLCAWIKPILSGSSRLHPVISKSISLNRDNYTLGYLPSPLSYLVFTEDSQNDENWSVEIEGYDYGQWHHVCGVREGSYLRLYIDGQLVDEANIGTFNPYIGSSYLLLGRIDNRSGSASELYFKGSLDEILIYNRALTASEIAGLAGATIP